MQSHRHGVIMLDTLIGLSLVSLLMIGLIFAAAQQQRAARRLETQRALTHRAEAAISRMQAGQPPTLDDPTHTDTTIEISPVANAEATAGRVWVKVTAREAAQSASLTALAPERALAAWHENEGDE